jgi:hypothetical protein
MKIPTKINGRFSDIKMHQDQTKDLTGMRFMMKMKSVLTPPDCDHLTYTGRETMLIARNRTEIFCRRISPLSSPEVDLPCTRLAKSS